MMKSLIIEIILCTGFQSYYMSNLRKQSDKGSHSKTEHMEVEKKVLKKTNAQQKQQLIFNKQVK